MRAATLLRVAADWQDRPFRYGVADCCQFARHLVREMTGHDYGAEWQYSSEKEAQTIIESHGGLEPLISSYLGPAVAASALRVGDLCLVTAPNFEMMGARSGSGAYVPSSGGIIVARAHRIAKGWMI